MDTESKMELKILKRVDPQSGAYVLLPRALNVPAQYKMALIPLSRSGEGCLTPLSMLEAHDSHAPGFQIDGSSPAESSAAHVTAETYLAGIKTKVQAALKGEAPMAALPTDEPVVDTTPNFEESEESVDLDADGE